MSTVLVSFIGKGILSHVENGQRSYKSAIYKFSNGFEIETTFFGIALKEFLARKDVVIDRWLILGTSGSNWGNLADLFGNDVYSASFDWISEIESKDVNEGVTQDDLDNAPDILKSELNAELVLIPYASKPDEQNEFIATVCDRLQSGEDVILDVTHGLRHHPLMMSFVTMGLWWLKGVKVTEVYYGAFDLRAQNEGRTPVYELSVCRELSEKSNALATYKTTGNFRAMGDVFPEQRGLLEQVSFFEDIGKMGEAKKPAAKLKTALSDTSKMDKWDGEIARNLVGAFEWTDNDKYIDRCYEKACFFFGNKEYLKSVLMLYEAFLRKAMNYCGFVFDGSFDCKAKEETEKELRKKLSQGELDLYYDFKNLRNSLAHGTQPGGGRTTNATKEEEKFRILFDDFKKLMEGLDKKFK